jgi:transposase
MAITDRHGLPVALCTASASPAEVTLVSQTIDQRFVADLPERVIGDKAYDSDGLDEKILSEYGTEVVAPHRRGRRAETKTQDGRVLRRYKKRWKVERFFAWLNNYRRVVVRWEYHAENYLGFLHLACLVILLRHL